MLLVRLEPMLGVYSELVRYYLAVSLGAHRSTGKLLSVLASIFTELAQKVAPSTSPYTSPFPLHLPLHLPPYTSTKYNNK